MSITRSLRYGAAELKRLYNRNLAFALVISVAVHLALICLYLIVTPAGAVNDPDRPTGGPIVTVLEDFDPPVKPKAPPQIPPKGPQFWDPAFSGSRSGRGGKNVFGDMLAVPDEMVDDSLQKISTLDHLGVALAQPRGDSEFGGGPDNGGTDLGLMGKQTLPRVENEPDPSEDPGIFVAVEEEPQFDMNELHDLVKYPEMAQRNRIEGKVTVQVFVDKMGRPAKVQIAESSNRLFDPAAIEAVQGTRFTPARQNGTPVGVWVTIPIVFTIR
jgi:TonB family protein